MLLLVLPSLYLHGRFVSNSKFLPWQPRMDLFLLVQTLEVQAGGGKEKDNCHWSKFIWEEKIILHQTCISADLQPQLENSCAPPCTEPLSWTRGVKLCPVFSLKAQRRAVSKLLMNSKQSSLSSLCAVSWGHDQGDNQPPSWNLWGLLCSSSSALINSLCSSSWKLNCSVLPEIQSSAESFSIAFHWQRRTRFFREMHACCSSREHAEHTGLIKSLWEGISMLTHVL